MTYAYDSKLASIQADVNIVGSRARAYVTIRSIEKILIIKNGIYPADKRR